jgi:hypothetical protein
MPKGVRYRNKDTQSDIVMGRYRIEKKDTGMPMPALVFWMPMPTSARTSANYIGPFSTNSLISIVNILHCYEYVLLVNLGKPLYWQHWYK